MSQNNTAAKTISSFAKQNTVWILIVLFAIANLYLGSLLSPLKGSVAALAEKQDSVEVQLKEMLTNGTIPGRLNEERVKNIDDKLDDIEARQTRMEEKIDRLLESK